MANEIRTSIDLRVSKGNLSLSKRIANAFDMTGTRYCAKVQSIGTGFELVDIDTDVVIAGWAVFINHDPTNYVEIGFEDSGSLAFTPLLKLLPGEFQLFRLATKTIVARANTAAVDLEFLVLEA
jgi:hypothetical protein